MRSIGHLDDELRARRFGDYLYAQDIENTVEPDGGRWTVWIHSEEQLDQARGLLDGFRTRPDDSRYAEASKTARQKRERLEAENEAAQRRHFDRATLFPARVTRIGPVTLVLMVAAGVVTLLTAFGGNDLFPRLFSIVPFEQSGGYIRYRGGVAGLGQAEIWRWFTPVLVHMGWLHLLFNLLWLKDLGSQIESRLGAATLLGLVLLTSVPPNMAQFLFAGGPAFGGLSGVVYGLLGYIWIRGRLDPSSRLYIDPTSVMIMMVWFFLCLFQVIPHVANTVHAVGLGLGALAGYAAALRGFRR